MRIRLFTIAVLLLSPGFPGCQSISTRPDPEWLAAFDQTDSISLSRENDSSVRNKDPHAITRLRGIYENAKWKNYWHTVPASITWGTIYLHKGDTVLRHFSFDGNMWERDGLGGLRVAELTRQDREWIYAQFDIGSAASEGIAAEESREDSLIDQVQLQRSVVESQFQTSQQPDAE